MAASTRLRSDASDMMRMFLGDVRHALLAMRREKRFAATALATLALGIGVTGAVFSIVYGVLLRPLPYPDSDRLVRVYEEHPGAPRMSGEPPLTNTTMYAWRARLGTLEGLAAYYAREYTVVFEGEGVRVHGAEASASLFPILRTVAVAGRFFEQDEEPRGRNLVVVISDRLWRDRFARRADTVGRSLLIEGKPHVIIGVAAPELRFPDADTQLWTPYDDPTLSDPSVQGGMWLAPTLGRLVPGASVLQVAAEGTTAARSIPRPAVANILFGAGGPVEVRAERLVDQMTARVRPALMVLAISVVFVLLIGCANVANLFLSRGVSRQRELAVRTALGASRAQLARQLLAESFLFAAGGGVLGLSLAWTLLRFVPFLAPHDFPRLDAVRLDLSTVGFTVAASAVAALTAGLLPALRGARVDVASALHPGDGAQAGGFGNVRAQRARDVLLVAESATATLLLIGAALLARSFVALTSVDAGYEASNVLIARVYPAAGGNSNDNVQFVARLLDRLRAAPGVVAAGAGNMMPFNDSTWLTAFDLPPSAGRGKPAKVRAVSYLVTTGYAEALRLRLREGRMFTDADSRIAGPLKLIVNQEFVRQYLTSEPAAGRTFAGGPYKTSGIEIVGVVNDVLKDGNDAAAQPEIYSVATAARPIGDEINVVMRMDGDPSAGAAVVRSAVGEVSRAAAVGELIPLTARAAAAAAQPRFAMAVLAAFATLALVLASVGLYGMLSYAVVRRRRELGVRAAIGAGRRDLVTLVVSEGLARAVAGIVIGLAVAAFATDWMRSLLFGVTPLDPAAYAAAPALLLPVAFAACLGPAWRAAATDPAVVLRGE